jgi:glutathione peroxidase
LSHNTIGDLLTGRAHWNYSESVAQPNLVQIRPKSDLGRHAPLKLQKGISETLMANSIANSYLNRKTDWSFTAVISLLSLIIALPFAAFAQSSAQNATKDGATDGKTTPAAPKIALEEREHDFGKVSMGKELSHTFKIKNEGVAELIIHNVSPACGCTASEFPKKLAPGEEGKITLSVKTAGMNGKIDRYADIISNDATQAGLKLWLHMDVHKDDSNIVNSGGANNMAEKSVLDFSLKNIDGKETKLSDYRGKVLLLVNVASKCGYTPQYEGLQAIHSKYSAQGLVVMGLPANNFGGQEPGTNEEIKQFCTVNYKVAFPMFAKISVKGADIHPLYKYLTSKETNPEFGGDIKWNFNKFLVDRNGKIIARFDSGDKPEGEKVTQAIENALK